MVAVSEQVPPYPSCARATTSGTQPRDHSTPTRGLDYLLADAEELATRFKEKEASADAARASGVLEESISQALLQPTIDDYELHAVPFRTVSTRVAFSRCFLFI